MDGLEKELLKINNQIISTVIIELTEIYRQCIDSVERNLNVNKEEAIAHFQITNTFKIIDQRIKELQSIRFNKNSIDPNLIIIEKNEAFEELKINHKYNE